MISKEKKQAIMKEYRKNARVTQVHRKYRLQF